MSTTRASTPRVSRASRGIFRSLVLVGAFAAVVGPSFLGCSFGWDGYDPRLSGAGGGAATSTATTGETGPTTSAGGASSTSVTSGASTTGATSSAAAGGGSSTAATGGAGGGSSSSSGTGGGGGGPTKCGGTSVLVDDFPGGDPGELWSANSNGNVLTEAGGEAVITLPNNSPNGSWGEFDSRRAYDFRGDSVSIELASATNTATTAQSWFGTGYDSNYLQIYQKHGQIHFEYQLAGTTTNLKTIPFDPVAHRHWRFREDGTTTFWEASSDGVNWTTMAQVDSASLFPMNLMWVWFGAGTDGGEVNPGAAHFDKVNGGGLPKEKYCPTSSFTDDFNDGLKSLAWERGWEDNPGMLAETGGQLVVSLVPNDTASAMYGSSSSFDLTGSSLVVEVPSVVTTAGGSETRVALIAPGDDQIELSVNQGHFYCSIKTLGNWQDLGSVLYSSMQHRWWRVRESAGTLYVETSPDGKAWAIQGQASPVPIAIDGLAVFLGSGAWMAQPSPGISHFDNLNLPPP